MKLQPECIPCMVNFAFRHAKLATDDIEVQFRALSSFLEFLAKNISAEAVPAMLGTKRDRIILAITSNPDPFANYKRLQNEAAKKLLEDVRLRLQKMKSDRSRLRFALMAATVGNSLEFAFMGRALDEAIMEEFLGSSDLGPDLEKIVTKLIDAEEVLYLTDNAGEIMLDIPLIEELARMGKKLSVAAKASPVIDDVTLEEIRALGIGEVVELLSAGDFVGIDFETAPRELLRKLEGADVIISKGMGNYETLSEHEEKLGGRLVYLLKAKCEPVARSLGVEKGKFVAKLTT